MRDLYFPVWFRQPIFRDSDNPNSFGRLRQVVPRAKEDVDVYGVSFQVFDVNVINSRIGVINGIININVPLLPVRFEGLQPRPKTERRPWREHTYVGVFVKMQRDCDKQFRWTHSVPLNFGSSSVDSEKQFRWIREAIPFIPTTRHLWVFEVEDAVVAGTRRCLVNGMRENKKEKRVRLLFVLSTE